MLWFCQTLLDKHFFFYVAEIQDQLKVNLRFLIFQSRTRKFDSASRGWTSPYCFFLTTFQTCLSVCFFFFLTVMQPRQSLFLSCHSTSHWILTAMKLNLYLWVCLKPMYYFSFICVQIVSSETNILELLKWEEYNSMMHVFSWTCCLSGFHVVLQNKEGNHIKGS